jgi:hypothetical protein
MVVIAGLTDPQQKFAIPIAAFVADERAVWAVTWAAASRSVMFLDSWS